NRRICTNLARSSSAVRSFESSDSWMAYSSSIPTPLRSWAPTADPADVPTTRSASVRSTPHSCRPWAMPISHAIPVTPPPARTRARDVIRSSGHGRVARQAEGPLADHVALDLVGATADLDPPLREEHLLP